MLTSLAICIALLGQAEPQAGILDGSLIEVTR